jgi:hypothetical protein
MHNDRFDGLVRRLGSGSITRRSLLGLAGAGAATTVAARPLFAQEATPVPEAASETTDDTVFLFVQVANGGAWGPHPDNPELFILTLDNPAEQTIYFSDRPERIVGTVSTPVFLENLGFTPGDPPNAALVAQGAEGEAVLVVELFNPRYEQTFGETPSVSLPYDARVLAEYSETGLHSLEAQPVDTFPAEFESPSLFIDDCSDRTFYCCLDSGGGDYDYCVGDIGKQGMCYHWQSASCRACRPDQYNQMCNEQFANCDSACRAIHFPGWPYT